MSTIRRAVAGLVMMPHAEDPAVEAKLTTCIVASMKVHTWLRHPGAVLTYGVIVLGEDVQRELDADERV